MKNEAFETAKRRAMEGATALTLGVRPDFMEGDRVVVVVPGEDEVVFGATGTYVGRCEAERNVWGTHGLMAGRVTDAVMLDPVDDAATLRVYAFEGLFTAETRDLRGCVPEELRWTRAMTVKRRAKMADHFRQVLLRANADGRPMPLAVRPGLDDSGAEVWEVGCPFAPYQFRARTPDEACTMMRTALAMWLRQPIRDVWVFWTGPWPYGGVPNLREVGRG